MKRILAAIIILILSIGLWGCGTQEKSQFDEATNQVVSFHGINFQIPAAWTSDVQDQNFIQYTDEKTGNFKHGLGAIFQSDIKISELLELRKTANGTDDGSGIDYKNYEESTVTIAKTDATRIEYYRVIKGQKYMYIDILLERNQGVISIEFFSTDLVGLEDFDKVVETITAK